MNKVAEETQKALDSMAGKRVRKVGFRNTLSYGDIYCIDIDFDMGERVSIHIGEFLPSDAQYEGWGNSGFLLVVERR